MEDFSLRPRAFPRFPPLQRDQIQRNFRRLTIEASPAQSQQPNQSYCQADGYIYVRADPEYGAGVAQAIGINFTPQTIAAE
jgi:hypothetical protein